MTIVGAQDFQSGEQWQSQVLMNISLFFPGPGNHTWPDTGPAAMAVANWQGLQFKASASTGCDYVVRWWSDQFKSQQLGERRFTISTFFNDTYLTLPNLGPYFNIQATNGAAGANTASFVITGTNRVTGPFQPPSSLPMIIRAFAGILGGASVTVQPAYLYAGPACFAVNHDSNEGWLAVLSCSDSASTATEVAYLGDRLRQSGDLSQIVILPPRPVSLTIFNTGAAAHSFSAAVTPDVFR